MQKYFPLARCSQHSRTTMTTDIVESSNTPVFIPQQNQRKTSHRHGNRIAPTGHPAGASGIDPGTGKQDIILLFIKLRIMVRRC